MHGTINYIKFSIGDFFNATGRMTLEEKGIFIDLCNIYVFQLGDMCCTDASLSHIGTDLYIEANAKQMLSKCLPNAKQMLFHVCETEEKRLSNEWLNSFINKGLDIRNKRIASGKKGGSTKHSTDQNNCTKMGKSLPMVSHADTAKNMTHAYSMQHDISMTHTKVIPHTKIMLNNARDYYKENQKSIEISHMDDIELQEHIRDRIMGPDVFDSSIKQLSVWMNDFRLTDLTIMLKNIRDKCILANGMPPNRAGYYVQAMKEVCHVPTQPTGH